MIKDFFSNPDKNEYIKKYLDNRLEKYSSMNYIYLVMNKKNMDDMIFISDFPEEISDNYLNNKYQYVDPVIINALSRFTHFSWDENLKINSMWTVKRIFEKIKSHNIIRGHAFVLHENNNNLAMLLFYIDKFLTSDIDDVFNKNRDELQGVLIDTHEMLLNVYSEADEVKEKVFSSRESEILYWCSKGYTYSQVAEMLNITVSTIKFHMGKVVKKMGVKNAKHAISLGIELNMISLPIKNKGAS